MRLRSESKSSTDIARHELRRKFVTDLRTKGGPCEFQCHIFHPGGPHPSVRLAWRRMANPVDPSKEAATIAKASLMVPEVASRAMRREFFSRFSPTQLSPAIMRAMHQFLTRDTAAAETVGHQANLAPHT